MMLYKSVLRYILYDGFKQKYHHKEILLYRLVNQKKKFIFYERKTELSPFPSTFDITPKQNKSVQKQTPDGCDIYDSKIKCCVDETLIRHHMLSSHSSIIL